jgi:hypothetical protein
MTALRPVQAGDQARADAVVAAARAVAERYTDYRKALADGYTIFMPNMEQKVYHFSLGASAVANERGFDASRPTSLLYEKVKGGDGYKLLGVMYTAPFRASEEELNERVPLSIARWHLHTNLCLPPAGMTTNWIEKDPKFGLTGSITTREACTEAGGRFIPHLFGWMVHVYPFETDPKKVWSAGMEDEHGMDHDLAMPGMKM